MWDDRPRVLVKGAPVSQTILNNIRLQLTITPGRAAIILTKVTALGTKGARGHFIQQVEFSLPIMR